MFTFKLVDSLETLKDKKRRIKIINWTALDFAINRQVTMGKTFDQIESDIKIYQKIAERAVELKNEKMKKHFVNLLLEEFKQQAFFDDLEKKGLTLSEAIVVKNWDIVADIVGFPSDNTLEYDFVHMNGGERDKSKKMPDDEMFCRDFLYDNYYDSIESIAKNQEIFVTDKELAIKEYFQEEIIKEKLSNHIDWLYDTFQKYKNGELE